MSDKFTIWDPDFGKGVSISDGNGNALRISGQGALGTFSGREMIYGDDAGRNATLGNLKPDEMSFLLKKHF